MDNINHSCKLLITNNSSWDLPMISMEPQQQQQQQQHNLINFHDQYQHQHQNIIIPTKNDNPQNPFLFPINHSLHDLRTVLAPGAVAAAEEEDEEAEAEEEEEEEAEELGAMKEMMYKMAAMQPVDIDPATIRKPKRRNVRISDDPQSVAARRRRERISERIRILQRLVPGGTKMDTASMLDEAIRYVKFLKRQIRLLNKPSNFTNIHNNNNITNNYSLLASSSSSLDHNINWGAFDNYKLLLADQYNVHSHGKSSTTSGGSAAAGGFFAAGRGGRY